MKIDHKKATNFIYILVVVLVIEGFVFLSQSRSGDEPHAYIEPSVYPEPTVYVDLNNAGLNIPDGTPIPVPAINVPYTYNNTYNDGAKWPRTFYVISKSVTASNSRVKGADKKIYNYGEKVVLSHELEILNGKDHTGYTLENNAGLILDVFYPNYTRVFPVSVNAYRDLPVEIKYKILQKSGVFCGFPNIEEVDSISSILSGDIPSGIDLSGYYNSLANLSYCATKFAMPRSTYTAEHSVAYANIDDNIKTPDHILIVTENTEYSSGSNCAGNVTIFSIDADGDYYARDLSVYGVCYVDTIKKGSVVKITKIVSSGDGSTSKEVKEDFTIPTDSFVVHTENNGLVYLLYDKTTSSQVKSIYESQNIY